MVVVFPLVPVTSITLKSLHMHFNIFLSNFKATFPGKLVPPLNNAFDSFIIILEIAILKKDFILIFHTTLLYK